MDTLIYYAVRGVFRLVQALPLRWAARLGRGCGRLAFLLDARHRRVALDNLRACFGAEKSPRGNPGNRRREFPAHRRELRLRHQDGGDVDGRTARRTWRLWGRRKL